MNAPNAARDIIAVLDNIAKPSPAVAWLNRAGPLARRLNEESRHDTDDALTRANYGDAS